MSRTLDPIACVLCGVTGGDVAIRENGHNGVRCVSCGMIYVAPRPEKGEIINRYAHNSAFADASWHLDRRYQLRLYARVLLGALPRDQRRGDLLELGAGGGFLLEAAEARGFRAFGIECNRALTEHIRAQGRECEHEPLSEASFGGRSFDVIVHRDVLSHLHDPVADFRMMHARLREGGHLVFQTGNHGDVAPRYYSLIAGFQYPDHLHLFTENGIVELLRQSGFELVGMRRYSVLPQLWLIRLRQRLRGRSALSEARPGAHPGEESFVGRMARMLHGCFCYGVIYMLGAVLPKQERPQNLVVVARKRAAPAEDLPAPSRS